MITWKDTWQGNLHARRSLMAEGDCDGLKKNGLVSNLTSARGYDLAEAIKVWLNKNNDEAKSVCEELKERGWEGIGETEVFLSHVQAESPGETLNAMYNIDLRQGPARKGTKHMAS